MLRQALHTFKRLSRRKEIVIITTVLLFIVLITSYISFDKELATSIKEKLPEHIDKLKENLPEIPDLPDLPELPDWPEVSIPKFLGGTEDFKNPQDFYKTVFKIINESNPNVPKLDKFKSDERLPNIRFDEETDIEYTKEYLSKFLDISEEQINKLKGSHSQVISKFPSNIPKDFYGKQQNGIIYVGGGKFNWLAMLSLKTLRNLGSRLPVEILIPTLEDYEPNLCEHEFPKLNAKCLVLPDILGQEVNSMIKIQGYQYKSLAILVSSFQNVLLLDADNIPVSIPDQIFHSNPFQESGLIIWPDFWRRTTSPDYYTIANINITSKRIKTGVTESEKSQTGIPLHHLENSIPDPTSESGQLIINKTQHFQTMLLSLYYNVYGPDYYYPLFSQGAMGEGDKETFLAAAVALDEPLYQMNQSLVALGRFDSKGDFHGCSMGQFDPIQDYNKNKGNDDTDPRILFIHANFPKLDPVLIQEEKKLFDGDERIRIFGPGLTDRIGYDFEFTQWLNMKILLCEQNLEFKLFEGKNRHEICRELDVHLEFLDKTIDQTTNGRTLPKV
ncbi:Alpha-1,2-mannosyltransferase [Wickerhamomyces ciferrii]|uniref:Alpha-1,2-mannosyltransferase n=1 Tax=Wickerhamomyces ciferrii (strain ATCC 14091 / BCRC 22168 / CBS 111 / JCM 3599 / NBRC 0793 / NRRL Y-1031 F-60-10) TaxID=1206466 RepID=K0KT40_WICCF|nr:Alpha-1,2-mannosyltransferase [Wickerhamomyces ciferrii]CCH44483.1 Alpha-1,2-mannosyltransferase [Wickerhamomyces ciferrii]